MCVHVVCWHGPTEVTHLGLTFNFQLFSVCVLIDACSTIDETHLPNKYTESYRRYISPGAKVAALYFIFACLHDYSVVHFICEILHVEFTTFRGEVS